MRKRWSGMIRSGGRVAKEWMNAIMAKTLIIIATRKIYCDGRILVSLTNKASTCLSPNRPFVRQEKQTTRPIPVDSFEVSLTGCFPSPRDTLLTTACRGKSKKKIDSETLIDNPNETEDGKGKGEEEE